LRSLIPAGRRGAFGHLIGRAFAPNLVENGVTGDCIARLDRARSDYTWRGWPCTYPLILNPVGPCQASSRTPKNSESDVGGRKTAVSLPPPSRISLSEGARHISRGYSQRARRQLSLLVNRPYEIIVLAACRRPRIRTMKNRVCRIDAPLGARLHLSFYARGSMFSRVRFDAPIVCFSRKNRMCICRKIILRWSMIINTDGSKRRDLTASDFSNISASGEERERRRVETFSRKHRFATKHDTNT